MSILSPKLKAIWFSAKILINISNLSLDIVILIWILYYVISKWYLFEKVSDWIGNYCECVPLEVYFTRLHFLNILFPGFWWFT